MDRHSSLYWMGGGFFAAIWTLMVSLALGVFGFRGVDPVAVYGGLFGPEPLPYVWTIPWVAGLALYLAVTAGLVPLVVSKGRGASPRRLGLGTAVAIGFVLWVLVEAAVKPLAGCGFFSRALPHPLALSLSSLFSSLVYAALFVPFVRSRPEEAVLVYRQAA
jgi:hypothetical protein